MSDQHEVVEAMQDAVDGRIASVTIAGRTYDRLDTLAQAYCEALRLLYGAGVVEIGARNPNVASYCDHWEGRAEKAEAALSEREKELAEWRDIKEQMRCLTIYSKRDLQVKVAMQIRLREAAEKELARLRSALELISALGAGEDEPPFEYGDPNGGLTHDDLFDIYDAGFVCAFTRCGKIARAALSPSQESSVPETISGETKQ